MGSREVTPEKSQRNLGAEIFREIKIYKKLHFAGVQT